MNIKLEATKQRLTIDEFNTFEKSLNARLPDSFKELYMEYNGGVPDRDYFPDSLIEGNLFVSTFLPIKYGKFPIESFYGTDLSDYLPVGFLPFANSPTGDDFCLDLKNGNVVVCYEEGEMEKLADTFGEFIDALQVEEGFIDDDE